mmetsp:Transcript_68409/g.154940  ORF Transcript_68409/g.154940 Transcript_68409/m.154940 type:complete len:204 (-) Transcript_68409:166-777(-)
MSGHCPTTHSVPPVRQSEADGALLPVHNGRPVEEAEDRRGKRENEGAGACEAVQPGDPVELRGEGAALPVGSVSHVPEHQRNGTEPDERVHRHEVLSWEAGRLVEVDRQERGPNGKNHGNLQELVVLNPGSPSAGIDERMLGEHRVHSRWLEPEDGTAHADDVPDEQVVALQQGQHNHGHGKGKPQEGCDARPQGAPGHQQGL